MVDNYIFNSVEPNFRLPLLQRYRRGTTVCFETNPLLVIRHNKLHNFWSNASLKSVSAQNFLKGLRYHVVLSFRIIQLPSSATEIHWWNQVPHRTLTNGKYCIENATAAMLN